MDIKHLKQLQAMNTKRLLALYRSVRKNTHRKSRICDCGCAVGQWNSMYTNKHVVNEARNTYDNYHYSIHIIGCYDIDRDRRQQGLHYLHIIKQLLDTREHVVISK